MSLNDGSLVGSFRRAIDPAFLARDLGVSPDPWQAELLRSNAPNVLLNCSRQAGKSTASALVALDHMLHRAPATVVVVSPTQKQSDELFRKWRDFWQRLPSAPAARTESAALVELVGGSRIIALPGSKISVRGYSANLLLVDECAQVDTDVMTAVLPTVVTGGRVFCLSTPRGRANWFAEQWHGNGDWHRVKVTADQIPRFRPEYLASQREQLGEMRFAEEFMCEFRGQENAVFLTEWIERALVDVDPITLRPGF